MVVKFLILNKLFHREDHGRNSHFVRPLGTGTPIPHDIVVNLAFWHFHDLLRAIVQEFLWYYKHSFIAILLSHGNEHLHDPLLNAILHLWSATQRYLVHTISRSCGVKGPMTLHLRLCNVLTTAGSVEHPLLKLFFTTDVTRVSASVSCGSVRLGWTFTTSIRATTESISRCTCFLLCCAARVSVHAHDDQGMSCLSSCSDCDHSSIVDVFPSQLLHRELADDAHTSFDHCASSNVSWLCHHCVATSRCPTLCCRLKFTCQSCFLDLPQRPPRGCS